MRILSINALQRFNDWTAARAEEARALAAYAKDCGAEALVLCPVNDMAGSPRRASARRSSRRRCAGYADPGQAGIMGLVEPLGFEECSLRYKQDAVEAIEELDLGDRFRLVHDTFHHYLAGEPRMFPEHTGLVHISGVEDASLPLEPAPGRAPGPGRGRRSHRQHRARSWALMEGYGGAYSFEPFAASVQRLDDIEGALEASMHWIDREIARLPA